MSTIHSSNLDLERAPEPGGAPIPASPNPFRLSVPPASPLTPSGKWFFKLIASLAAVLLLAASMLFIQIHHNRELYSLNKQFQRSETQRRDMVEAMRSARIREANLVAQVYQLKARPLLAASSTLARYR